MAAALESTRPVSRACIWCDRPPRPDGRCAGCGRLLAACPTAKAARARRPSRRAVPALIPPPPVVDLPPAVAAPVALAPVLAPPAAVPVALAPVLAPPAAVPAAASAPLTEKYRPRDLSGVEGQSWVVLQLRGWLEAPHSGAFLFSGATGTGKTSTALALAAELGILTDAFCGGFQQIASGEQTAESVRSAMRGLSLRPMVGSGWKRLVINECDVMTLGAAAVWLDALENLPDRACVVFTTNNAAKLPQRLRDRCERMDFESSALLLAPDLRAFAAKVWAAELGRDDAPDPEDLGQLADADGNASFRRLLQHLEPAVRAARAGLPWKRVG
jgi:hypothetical protein